MSFQITQNRRSRWANVTDGRTYRQTDNLLWQCRTLHYVHRAIKVIEILTSCTKHYTIHH